MENNRGECFGGLLAGALGCGGCLVQLAIGLLITCILANWLCDISPEKTYTWYSGIWQGLWFFPNLIRSLFTDAIFRAHYYTTGYNIWWWIVVVCQCLGIIGGGSTRG